MQLRARLRIGGTRWLATAAAVGLGLGLCLTPVSTSAVRGEAAPTGSISGRVTRTYTLVGWHERVGEQKTSITVSAGRAARADISLPVEDPQ